MKISIIAAIGPKRELGKDNKLLWHLPGDLPRFKKLTQNHAVIMGRKTFESLGKPLPNRLNIVLTRHRVFPTASPQRGPKPLSQKQVSSLEEAFKVIKSDKEIFIIGGGQIYTQALPLADKLYLTLVEKTPQHPNGKFDADTFFPEYEKIFTKKVFEERHDENGYKFTFVELIK